MVAASQVIDLCHVVKPGMVTYPGLPGPELTDHMSRLESREKYSPGTEFQIGRITMVANTGTYLDAPFHRFPDGADLSGVPLTRLVDIDGVVVDATGRDEPGIDSKAFAGEDIAGKAVLVRTDWSKHWGTESYGAASHPFLTEDAAAYLADRGPALVGIDSVNIDSMNDCSRPAHTALLAADIPIVEHMRGLDQLPALGFRLHSAPVAVVGMGTFPVRVYALVD
jgi:kynurenine formamidase